MFNKIKQIVGLGKVDSWLLAKDKLPDKLYYNHPQVKRLIQKAFTIKDGKKKYTFYEFKEIHDMPSRRFSTLNELVEDNARKMTNEELLHYSDQCLAEIDQNKPENLANVITIIKMMKMRSEYVINSDMILRLISCAFFTKDEDLLRYDWDLGDWKIDLFERHGLKTFFLFEPVTKYLPLTNISDGDIEIILSQRKATTAYLKELNKLGISTVNPYDAKKRMQDFT